jgi:hypothetical protein
MGSTERPAFGLPAAPALPHRVATGSSPTDGIGQPAGVTHVFYEPAIAAKADFKATEFSFSVHKTTEQTQVLS